MDLNENFTESVQFTRPTKGPYHFFPKMEDSERLTYEILSTDNFIKLFEMFHQDDSPFVDIRFKSVESTKQYAEESTQSRFFAKYGSCDFLIKLKENEICIGILHLYDYSLETYSDVPERCTIGFSIAAPYRKNYYATEAVQHLIAYANQHHNKTRFLSYTHVENKVANAFLVSLNMTLKNEDYIYGGGKYNYYLLEIIKM
jgi:RimJ/RimL family protein N-acetyltransferase